MTNLTSILQESKYITSSLHNYKNW